MAQWQKRENEKWGHKWTTENGSDEVSQTEETVGVSKNALLFII